MPSYRKRRVTTHAPATPTRPSGCGGVGPSPLLACLEDAGDRPSIGRVTEVGWAKKSTTLVGEFLGRYGIDRRHGRLGYGPTALATRRTRVFGRASSGRDDETTCICPVTRSR